MLSDVEILSLLNTGTLLIEPFDAGLLRPSSYALRLGEELLVLTGDAPADVASCRDRDAFRVRPSTQGRLIVEPGEFVLVGSAEAIRMPVDVAGLLSLASRVARLGLLANGGAMLVHAGFGSEAPARLTFELFNATRRSIALRPGMPFCHLAMYRHEQSPAQPYRARPCELDDGPAPAEF